MLRDREPQSRWPDDISISSDQIDSAVAEMAAFPHRSLVDSLRQAVAAARTPIQLQPVLETQGPALSVQRSVGAADIREASFAKDAEQTFPCLKQKQVMLFFAGIGAVTIGKYVVIALVSSGAWSSGNGIGDVSPESVIAAGTLSSAGASATAEAEPDLQRFAFTSGHALLDAAAALTPIGRVSLDDQTGSNNRNR